MIMRKDVDPALTWDLSSIYKTEEDMYRDADRMKQMAEAIEKEYKGKLNSPERIARCMDLYREVYTLSVLTGNYCDLAVSVDYYDEHNQDRNDRISRLSADIFSRLSFIRTELSALDADLLDRAGEISPENRLYLKDIIREKPHMLSPETERVLAALSPSMEVPYQIYNMAKLADMKFPPFTAGGKEYPLGYSIFEDDYEYEKDTEIRRNAFRAFSKKLRDYENVTAAAYNARVQSEKAESSVRGYKSVFDFLLFPQKVTKEMYHRQIDLIMEHLAPHMQRYARLLQKIYGLDKMTFADLKIAVDPDFAPRISIQEAGEKIAEGLSILGEDYTDMIREAFRDRWIDFASNQGKSTGGFCASPYGRNSFILLTWNGRMADVFTIAHELGLSMHSFFSNTHQPAPKADYSLFVAEVASTCNEAVMMRHLTGTMTEPAAQAYLLNYFLEQFRTTVFRQTMFAEFEKISHDMARQGIPMTKESLSKAYFELNETYYGETCFMDPEIASEWMRIPHFYRAFYVYVYATGLCAAVSLSEKILRDGAPAVADYRRFLSAGCSVPPIEALKLAGIDMSSPEPVRRAMEVFREAVEKMKSVAETL